jgi:hypothetical protein
MLGFGPGSSCGRLSRGHGPAAGVAFSANPVTGDRDETVISAVRGLGEQLVSGQAEADEWVVRRTEATCRRVVDGALSPEQALARRIAEHFGGPQDVEWAFASGALAILQARPMKDADGGAPTTLGVSFAAGRPATIPQGVSQRLIFALPVQFAFPAAGVYVIACALGVRARRVPFQVNIAPSTPSVPQSRA